MTLGRRGSCDICLEFPNISGRHCEFSFRDGYWTVRDLNSQNGTKVNGTRLSAPRPLIPGDEVAIAKRKYAIQYTTSDEVRRRLDEMVSEPEEIWGVSLLEKAGLANPRGDARPSDSRRLTLDED